jgi:hypothetical protein
MLPARCSGLVSLARSWRTHRRLYARYMTMTAHTRSAAVAVTAMSRELAGSAWAEMTSPPQERCSGGQPGLRKVRMVL